MRTMRFGCDTHFTINFSITIQMHYKFCLAAIPLLAILLQQTFAQAMAAQLLCYMQMITLLEFGWKKTNLNLNGKNHYWNCSLYMLNIFNNIYCNLIIMIPYKQQKFWELPMLHVPWQVVVCKLAGNIIISMWNLGYIMECLVRKSSTWHAINYTHGFVELCSCCRYVLVLDRFMWYIFLCSSSLLHW